MGQQSVFPFEPLLHNVTQAKQVWMCYQKPVNTTVTCPRHKVLQQSHQEQSGKVDAESDPAGGGKLKVEPPFYVHQGKTASFLEDSLHF